jgi:4-hydroxybenzoate polyprenyltransferase
LKTQIEGLIRLTRFKEFLCFVVITTLLGASAGEGRFGWPLIGILVGNWLAVGFAFMINDVEDAPDDALTPHKATRNPVSARLLSPKAARIASFGVAFLALCFFATLGLVPFLLGGFSVVLGFLYSWRLVRFKTLPFLDMASHCLMLAGLQFLAAYFTFSPGFNGKWVFPFVCVMCISLYGELFNELRDLEGDIKAGLTHTAVLLGPSLTHIIMLVLGMIGIIAGIISIVVVGLIPVWVLILLAVLATILVTPQVLKIKRGKSSLQLQEPLQKPIEIAAAFALMVQFLVPWANALIPLSSILGYINFFAR